MNEANRSVRALDRESERHLRKRLVPSRVVAPGDLAKPVLRPLPGPPDLFLESPPNRAFVVAKGHRVESFLEPDERIGAVWTPVHKIANPEKPVAIGVELGFAKSPLERPEATMDIADHEVAPLFVDCTPKRFERNLGFATAERNHLLVSLGRRRHSGSHSSGAKTLEATCGLYARTLSMALSRPQS